MADRDGSTVKVLRSLRGAHKETRCDRWGVCCRSCMLGVPCPPLARPCGPPRFLFLPGEPSPSSEHRSKPGRQLESRSNPTRAADTGLSCCCIPIITPNPPSDTAGSGALAPPLASPNHENGGNLPCLVVRSPLSMPLPSESVSSVAMSGMPVALFSQSGPLPAATRITRIWTLNTGSLSCS